jgi:hypothetical protein
LTPATALALTPALDNEVNAAGDAGEDVTDDPPFGLSAVPLFDHCGQNESSFCGFSLTSA